MSKKFSFFAFAFLLGASQVCAADPRIEQGARFEARGAYEKALGEYRAMLAENPQNSEAYLLAGRVRMKMKDYNGAVANFRLAYRYNENLAEAYESSAKAFELMGQKAKANAERAKAPKGLLPNAAPAKAEPAKTEAPKASAKEEPAAKSEPAKVEDSGSVVDDPFEKGKELLAQKRYAEAAPMWRAVLSKKPGHAGAYYYAGVTRYEMGEYDKAEFNLKKGLAYKELGNDANFYLAMVYQKTGNPNQELRSLRAYLKKAAPDGRFRRKAENRVAELESIVESDKEKASAKSDNVAPKKESASKSQAAAKSSEDVIPPGNSIAGANQLFAEGDFEAALKMYKSLLDTDLPAEERYFAMLQMGNIYRELRDFHSAVTRYREVVKEYPDSDWATEAERALEDAVWLEKHSNELPRNR